MAPWPKVVAEFPTEPSASFDAGEYHVLRRPAENQTGSGSGGPIVEILLRNGHDKWLATLTTQSVGERLLAPFAGRPQIEMWGRAGGGYWTRSLFRFENGEYHNTRNDDFEEGARHHNEAAATAILPFFPHGDDDAAIKIVHFVETRIPK